MTKEEFTKKYSDVRRYDDALECIIDMHYDAMPFSEFEKWKIEMSDVESATYEEAEDAYGYLFDEYFNGGVI